jgi:hypothetical protein
MWPMTPRPRTARNRAAGDRASVDGAPLTLQRAHDVLGRRWMTMTGRSDAQRRAFYEYAARLYAEAANEDPDHHFEALALAALAQQDAEQLGPDDSASNCPAKTCRRAEFHYCLSEGEHSR